MRYSLAIIGILVCCCACKLSTVRIDEYEVQGIDVSHYQSFINWDRLPSQQIRFAFMKATEGQNMLDTLYYHNWMEAQRVGIKRGAYHFYRPTLSPELQARNFMNAVVMEYGDLPPVLDVEVLDGASKIDLLVGMRTWLYLIEINYGIKPIIYTNLKFYNKYLAGHFKDYPIWIARYDNKNPRLACGSDWHFWQYGNQGRLEGIAGDVDFNVFNGSIAQLEQLCMKSTTVYGDQIAGIKK